MTVQRDTDNKIAAIHDRLDTLESLSHDMREIKEWIATVVKVTRLFEIMGCFMTKWAVRLGKIIVAIAAVWAFIRHGIDELKVFFVGGIK